jgi:hypothetical protein
MLGLIATALEPLGKRAFFYLAAAVSDFYVPWETMVRKICFRQIYRWREDCASLWMTICKKKEREHGQRI